MVVVMDEGTRNFVKAYRLTISTFLMRVLKTEALFMVIILFQ